MIDEMERPSPPPNAPGGRTPGRESTDGISGSDRRRQGCLVAVGGLAGVVVGALVAVNGVEPHNGTSVGVGLTLMAVSALVCVEALVLRAPHTRSWRRRAGLVTLVCFAVVLAILLSVDR